MQRFERYDLNGTPVETVRVLRAAWTGTVDWATPATAALQAEQHRTVERLDALGRLLTQALPDGTTRTYDYDRLGALARVQVSTADGVLDGAVIADRITTDAHGRRSTMRLGNQTTVTYDYDPRTFRLINLRATKPGGEPLMDVGYTYDPVGNITSSLDRAQEPGTVTPLLPRPHRQHRVRLHLRPAVPAAHSDRARPPGPARGRRLAGRQSRTRSRAPDTSAWRTGPRSSATRRPTPTTTPATCRPSATAAKPGPGPPTCGYHRPRTDPYPRWSGNGVALTDPDSWFDAAGNTVRLAHLRRVEWDHTGRMVAATIIERPGTQPDDAEHYVHDGDGRRIRRVTERLQTNGQVEVTDTVYLDGCELRRVSLGGVTRLSRTTSHLTDGSTRLATLHQWTVDTTGRETNDVTAKKLHYLVTNHLGSVSLELDAAGRVISYEEYLPYGGTSFIAGDDAREVRLKDYRYAARPATTRPDCTASTTAPTRPG